MSNKIQKLARRFSYILSKTASNVEEMLGDHKFLSNIIRVAIGDGPAYRYYRSSINPGFAKVSSEEALKQLMARETVVAFQNLKDPKGKPFVEGVDLLNAMIASLKHKPKPSGEYTGQRREEQRWDTDVPE